MYKDYHLLQVLLIFPNECYQNNPFQNQYWQDVVTNQRCNVLKVKNACQVLAEGERKVAE